MDGLMKVAIDNIRAISALSRPAWRNSTLVLIVLAIGLGFAHGRSLHRPALGALQG